MWQLDGHLASASFGNLILSADLSLGARSVTVCCYESELSATLWHLPTIAQQPLVDCYVREQDLVCLLGPTSGFPFATQLYWTLRQIDFRPAPLATLSLLVSIRTDMLDTHPAVDVFSEVPAGRLKTLDISDGPAYAVRLGAGQTLVDVATPEDCASQSAAEATGGGVHIQRTLFDHFLEKGVIRQGRLFAAIIEGDIGPEAASHLCGELLAAELPLTA